MIAWSPTIRALNTHGLWLPAVRAFRQCRSRFFVVLTPEAASASNRCDVADVASVVSATCGVVSVTRRPASVLQGQAWQWALANRTPRGDLPSGKAIGQEFGRRERWGRLVKQAGLAGHLEPLA